MEMSSSIEHLAGAMAKAQASVRGAIKDAKNPHLKNHYADLASITDACREALTANNVAVVQLGVRAEDGSPWLKTILMHSSGQWVSGVLPLVTGEPKGISLMQALGSAITYARRYGLASATGVVTEDDDGNSAGHKHTNGHDAAKPAPTQPPSQPPAQDRIHNNDVQAIRELLVEIDAPEKAAVLWASGKRTDKLAELTPEEGQAMWTAYNKVKAERKPAA